jgi:hypothetical protein
MTKAARTGVVSSDGLGSAIRGFKHSLSTAERREEQPAIQPAREPDHTPGA